MAGVVPCPDFGRDFDLVQDPTHPTVCAANGGIVGHRQDQVREALLRVLRRVYPGDLVLKEPLVHDNPGGLPVRRPDILANIGGACGRAQYSGQGAIMLQYRRGQRSRPRSAKLRSIQGRCMQIASFHSPSNLPGELVALLLHSFSAWAPLTLVWWRPFMWSYRPYSPATWGNYIITPVSGYGGCVIKIVGSTLLTLLVASSYCNPFLA